GSRATARYRHSWFRALRRRRALSDAASIHRCAPPQSFAGPAESSRAPDKPPRPAADPDSPAEFGRVEAHDRARWRRPAPTPRSYGRAECLFHRQQKQAAIISLPLYKLAEDWLDGNPGGAL